jgi:hypothetical protein
MPSELWCRHRPCICVARPVEDAVWWQQDGRAISVIWIPLSPSARTVDLVKLAESVTAVTPRKFAEQTTRAAFPNQRRLRSIRHQGASFTVVEAFDSNVTRFICAGTTPRIDRCRSYLESGFAEGPLLLPDGRWAVVISTGRQMPASDRVDVDDDSELQVRVLPADQGEFALMSGEDLVVFEKPLRRW